MRTDLNRIVDRMEDALKQLSPPPKKTARLPKLEEKKFSGRIQEWQQFWDTFESTIDKNESLTAVDKFAYLRS